jgi:SAM-dependent methyltransferase
VDGSHDALAERAERALRRAVLYELQTGGGIALAAPARGTSKADAGRALAAIGAAVDELRSYFPKAPARLAAMLGGEGQRVLDVGAGARPWSLAFAARHETLRLTAFDLPGEQPAVRAAIGAARVGDRYEIVSGNVFTDEFEDLGTFDVVILANVCHVFDARRTQLLLERVARRVRAGGVLAIVDQVLETEPDWARWSALYAVGVLHIGPGGQLHSVDEYERWVCAAGLRVTSVRALCPLPPLSALIARRPATASESARADRWHHQPLTGASARTNSS